MIYLFSNTSPNLADAPDIKHVALLQISYMKFDLNLSDFDGLIITSKHAFSAIEFNQICISESVKNRLKIWAISNASANVAHKFGFKQIYTSQNSTGDAFAREILSQICGRNLYIKAKINVSNLIKILRENGANLDVIDGYENLPCANINCEKPAQNSVLIFTSPSNFSAFVDKFGWDKSYQVIAIGETTAHIMREICTPIISKKSDINACITLARSII